jgi:hypothetical protein
MANPEHFERLKQDIVDWNIWRGKNPSMKPDMSEADLRGVCLSQADLSQVNLRNANLGRADLSQANLSRADLRNANLSRADLSQADLSRADLQGALLSGTRLSGSDLYGADLYGTDLYGADLSFANLREANLREASLRETNLREANLREASLGWTIIANIDLSTTAGLTEIKHIGPSPVALYTVRLPQDGSAMHFLRGAGVPNEWIDDYRTRMMFPIQYHSCFISYSSKDELLARRLHADLQDQGVRCWFAPEDLKIGEKLRPRIDEAIHMQDKLLLLLSKHALASIWIEAEVEAALDKEQHQGREVLFPIRLDELIMQASQAWAKHLRRTRHIGDFTLWTDPQAYQISFDRLLRDLKRD